MPIDPICKREVPETTPFTTESGGMTYFFHNLECKKKFDDMAKNIIRVKRNLEDKKKISFGRLRKDIIRPGICAACGACAASCPSIILEGEKPKLIGPCNACGICYNQCPRTITTEDGLVGKIRHPYAARSTISRLKGQDGGVVTSLLAYALEEGLIDCAIVTVRSKEDPWRPVPVIATTYDELMDSAGTIYTHSMTIEALMNAVKQGMHSIAFVGPSCNIDAVYKMYKSPYGLLHMFMRVNLLPLGLFCMDTFSHEGIQEFVESKQLKLQDVAAMKIKRGNIELETSGKTLVYSLNELDPYRSSSCKFCTDLTAENANISFGGVGTPDGWTTVLTRTGRGYEIFKEAVENGYIEARDLEENEMSRVLNLARMKKVQKYGVERREK
ncbi:MAG: Coenzyme F420 hydrogenase/dehydrogenase, beta subunit C-terminal domain [Methanosarcinales archaeon]|nr:Coenzyme F420 hydrogenase/dehydrogenase, beta subunit C-terminal domain [Methanosarcinales archaeon]